eukprot:gnl/TRDRNA2_/TRDRNA2_45642_c0_seq1.p1 gnl/TRDRNA2_/TRDRNA2_45642_c0~~gnl/TRDRNA2_/TRDRNA2_45642_c0_seq1.p1  ORF type:complete len:303 (+),score=53.39 gnl/TRDRNA2_/TRDRNA2_45642_c0_seq1:94-1002(+)
MSSGRGLPLREPVYARFLAAATAGGAAELATYPLDTLKIRLQLNTATGHRRLGAFAVGRDLIANEGFARLFNGLTLGMLRQAACFSLVFSLYQPVRQAIAGTKEASEATVSQKLLAGGIAGAFGVAITNPLDVTKVRMQADSAGIHSRGTLHAIRSLVKNEGVRGMCTGMVPQVQRAIVMNAVDLGVYDESKVQLKKRLGMKEGMPLHVAASIITGVASALVSNPLDLAKHRLMAQPSGETTVKPMYKGTLHCIATSAKKEGVLSLWNGTLPSWARKGPKVVISYVVYEQVRRLLYSGNFDS